MRNKKSHIAILVILIILASIITEFELNIFIKAVLALVVGVSIAFNISKLNDDMLNKLGSLADKLFNLFKIVCILFVISIITVNLFGTPETDSRYYSITKNTVIQNSIISKSDIITKNIIINTVEVYDGIQYVYYSIINEEDKQKDIKSKYIDSTINNEIIEITDTLSLSSIEEAKNSVILILKCRKTFKNIGKLYKIQYLSLISFSVVLYIIIKKCIFFNKNRKTN